MGRNDFKDFDADKLREDTAETAHRTLQEARGERPKTPPPGERMEKKPQAVKRGRKGGKSGGKSRASKLSDDERRKAAQLAARARWKKGLTTPHRPDRP